MNTPSPISVIFKRTFQLALAMSMARLMNTITSFIGILMISRLGTSSLAASALMTSTQITLVVIAMSLLFAVGVMSARSFGAGKFEQVGIILQQGLYIATIMSIPVMLIMWKIQPILEFFGQTTSLSAIDQHYFTLYLFVVLPALWMICLQQSLLSIQKQVFVLIMSLFALAVSVSGGYLFIYGFHGIPAMGVAGLGLAYAIQVWSSFIIYIAYCYLNPRLKKFNLLHWHRGNHWDLMKKLLSIGWPICLQTTSDLASFTVVVLMVGWLGVTALAAQQISMQFFILLVVPIFAIAQASGILIGQARGAKNFLDMKRYGNMSMIIALGFGVIIMLVFIFLPHQLVRLYEKSAVPQPALEQLAVTVLILTGIRLLLDAANEVYVGSLRGLYDTKFPMIALTILTWIFGIPLCYLFGFVFHWGLIGMTCSGIIGMVVSCIVLYWRWRQQCRKLLMELPACSQ